MKKGECRGQYGFEKQDICGCVTQADNGFFVIWFWSRSRAPGTWETTRAYTNWKLQKT